MDGGSQPLRPSDLRTNLWRVSALLFGRGRAHSDIAGERRSLNVAVQGHSFSSWMAVESELTCLGTSSGSSTDSRRSEAPLTGRGRQDLPQVKDSRMSHRHSKHGFRPTADSWNRFANARLRGPYRHKLSLHYAVPFLADTWRLWRLARAEPAATV